MPIHPRLVLTRRLFVSLVLCKCSTDFTIRSAQRNITIAPLSKLVRPIPTLLMPGIVRPRGDHVRFFLELPRFWMVSLLLPLDTGLFKKHRQHVNSCRCTYIVDDNTLHRVAGLLVCFNLYAIKMEALFTKFTISSRANFSLKKDKENKQAVRVFDSQSVKTQGANTIRS